MIKNTELMQLLELVRNKKPLIHHITNYVTVNDCANITLAIGASPIMADAIEEAGDIAAISSALVLNIGTLNPRTIESMIEAGKSANKNGVPVVFDPVGAGASKLRNDATTRILNEIKISALRGNISEIRYISGLASNTKGVDASVDDMSDDANTIASDLSLKLRCVVAITGAVDTISDGSHTVSVRNGHPMMSSITGTGCMCSSLVGSFCGAAPESIFNGVIAAIICMGIAGEIAFEKAGLVGNGSFHMALLDAISKIDANTISGRAKVDEA
ncbi:MAG: hydroxyethylthiazole kinase [Fusobacteriaceae bacterium]|jgi:hydroxyethylthiazole kinase|nr:hydroxyethylthiazole kinase [Fusobacteriaceae bacterium]